MSLTAFGPRSAMSRSATSVSGNGSGLHAGPSGWTEATAPYLVRFLGFALVFGLAEVGRGSRMRRCARSSVGKLPVGFAGLPGVDIDD
jgi:hypothetical protein